MTSAITVMGEVYVEVLRGIAPSGADQLKVTVVKARDLLPKVCADACDTPPHLDVFSAGSNTLSRLCQESTSRCDPFVVVKLGDQEHTTSRLKNSRYPAWDSSFTFVTEVLPPTLQIIVRDGSRESPALLPRLPFAPFDIYLHFSLTPQTYQASAARHF